MKKFILFIIISGVLSCNKEDEYFPSKSVISYSYNCVIPTNHDEIIAEDIDITYDFNEQLVYLNYDNFGRLVGKKGNLIKAPVGAYVSYIFYEDTECSISYDNNIINVSGTNNITDNKNIDPFQKKYFVQDSHIYMMVNLKDNGYNDTTRYYYNDKLQLTKLIKSYGVDWVNAFYEKNFHYNENDNLSEILSEYYFLEEDGKKTTKYNDIETFENYDDKINEFSQLMIIEELFYRSLSKNNFLSYAYKRYNLDSHDESNLIKEIHFTWDEISPTLN